MTISMTIVGRPVDVDGGTSLGLKWESGIFSGGGIKLSRSFGLSVPFTPANDKTMDMSFSQDFPGLRHSAQCSIVAGGVALNGRVTLVEAGGGRYELLFVYGDLVSAAADSFSRPIGAYLADSRLSVEVTGTKTDVTVGGVIPDFGFYAYHNGAAAQGSAMTGGGAVGLFPTANLGSLIDAAAAGCGYATVYPSAHNQHAHSFGLVLPTMNTYSETVCRVTGSARNNYADVYGNLAAAGLTVVTRRYKRGRYNANVTAYVFQATRGITIKYLAGDAVTNTHNIFAKGQGYDFPQVWLDDHVMDYTVADFHLNAGEWFAVVNWGDMVTNHHKKYWHLTDGYTTAIDCTFKVLDDEGVVQVGETLSLADNLPEMSLAQLCQAYCGLCDLLVSVDEALKVIQFTPLSAILDGEEAVNLDVAKRGEVSHITRYIDGFSRHNYVRCQSADYVTEGMKFKRDYPCDNDAIDMERDFETVPFNEGNWETGAGGGKEAVFEDVEVGDNGNVQYKGVLSIVYEAPQGEYARHVQTINDEGVGVEAAAATLNACQCRVAAHIPFASFCSLRPGAEAVIHGMRWTVMAATWSGDTADLELAYLKS